MKNIILELKKITDNGYEGIILFEDGTIENQIVKNENLEKTIGKISIINELIKQLQKAKDLFDKVYAKDKPVNYPVFEIKVFDEVYYSFDLYLDLYFMIKYDKDKKLSVFDKYKQIAKEEKKNQSEKELKEIFDTLERQKVKIDISDVVVDDKIEIPRDIIKFSLKEVNTIELGSSRFFSSSIDIKDDFVLPKGFNFLGQLNLKELSEYDSNNLLPKEGYLYFFISPERIDNTFYEVSKVVYLPDENIVRKKISVGYDYDSILKVVDIKNEIEKIDDRYYIDDEGNTIYDSFKNEDVNKIYGYYTSCQASDDDIKKVSSKYVVLLQLGSDVFGEGVFSFLITEEDLKNKNFENVIFEYNQS